MGIVPRLVDPLKRITIKIEKFHKINKEIRNCMINDRF